MHCQWPGRSVSAGATMGCTGSPTVTRRDAAGLVGRSAGRLRIVPCYPGAGVSLPAVSVRPAGRHHHGLHALENPATWATAGGGDHDARPALGVYLHRLCHEIAAMDGPDVLVFAGVPLPPPGPGFLGIVIDEDSSAAHDDRHGQRDPVCASARLAVTCFTLAFSAWQISTCASCNR